MSHPRVGLVLVLACCQSNPTERVSLPCPAQALATGEIWVGPRLCAAQDIGLGESIAGDLWMANSVLRLAVRHPEASLTLPGVGGATIIDAAPWGHDDGLHEIVPMVAGGGLRVDELFIEEDRLRMVGRVVGLPHAPTDAEGASAEVSYIIRPDDPWLGIEGADGLWVHPVSPTHLIDDWLSHADIVYGHDGVIREDLGGAIIIDEMTHILIEPATTAWAHRTDATQPLTGTATGAEELQLFRGAILTGRIPLPEDGTFELDIPDSVDGVQAIATGKLPSAVIAPSVDLTLSLGGGGELHMDLGWDEAHPKAITATWTDPQHTEMWALLESSGGSLPLAAGAHDIVLSGDPQVVPVVVHVDMSDGENEHVGVRLNSAFDAGSRVLTAIGLTGDRSRHWRTGSDADVLREARAAGISWAVIAPEDDVAQATSYADDFGQIFWEDGVTLTSWDDWWVRAWPWKSETRYDGHGATPIAGLDPQSSLSLARGGPQTDRYTEVSMSWLDAVDAPVWMVEPQPDFVRLMAPAPDPVTSWSSWWRWLDAGRDVIPTGPLNWAEVTQLDRFGPIDVERALVRGHLCATTGPLVWLRAWTYGPGEIATRPDPTEPPSLHKNPDTPLTVEVDAARSVADHVTLFAEGGVTLASWEDVALPFEATVYRQPGRWVIAAAWWDDGEWAVTAPVWTETP